MCRLASFPPHFPRLRALEILLEMEDRNTDGTGSVYLNKQGEFVVDKWPKSLTKVLETEAFLTHMPHPGWTVVHLRAASHGSNKKVNTHPFIIDNNWAIVHNGIWSDHSLVRLALSPFCQFEGETDSEVAANLINLVGPKAFSDEISFSGVFLCLARDGHLWAIKTSGELALFRRKNETLLLASELKPDRYKSVEAVRGWYHFSAQGRYIAHKEKQSYYSSVTVPRSHSKSNVKTYTGIGYHVS